MNNKGFTLIELIVSILLLGVIMSVTTATVVNLMENSKQKSYDLLVKNIKIGAQGYFEECENQDPKNKTIPDCPTINNSNVTENGVVYSTEHLNIELKELLNYGFLKSSSKRGNIKIVENPKTNESINGCKIKITKRINNNNYAVNYIIEQVNTNYQYYDDEKDKTINAKCPTY